jgi:hypothetical protein
MGWTHHRLPLILKAPLDPSTREASKAMRKGIKSLNLEDVLGRPATSGNGINLQLATTPKTFVA